MTALSVNKKLVGRFRFDYEYEYDYEIRRFGAQNGESRSRTRSQI